LIYIGERISHFVQYCGWGVMGKCIIFSMNRHPLDFDGSYSAESCNNVPFMDFSNISDPYLGDHATRKLQKWE